MTQVAFDCDLRDRVLARLGFTAPPPATVDGLNALYFAWGQSVPFDKIQACLALSTGPAAPLPVLAGYEASRTNSRFNTRLFARKNVAGGVDCVTHGARHSRDPGGLCRRELAPEDVAQVLGEEFGYSEEIVAKLPPDDSAL